MRTYLVLWFLWAATLTYAGILGYLRYGPPTRFEVVRVPNTEHLFDPLGADGNGVLLKALTEAEKASAPDSISESREIPTGPARLHFEGLGFGQAMAALGLAFALPAILLVALRWISAGFRGSGA